MLEPLGAFPQEAELHIAAVVRESDALSVTVRTTASTATCPSCQQICGRVQSRYIRHVDDLPCSGLAVHLQVQVRRFRCLNARCARRIFSERVALLAEPYARRTTRLCDVVRHLGFACGGEGGARLAAKLGLSVSAATVLRLLRRTPLPAVGRLQVVGVDDWAWKKGARYGTIGCDLAASRPVALLPECSADSVAAWLQAHPAIQVISRDRGGVYAEGARRGAPQAQQVADRWHLLKNLGDAVEQLVRRERVPVRPPAPDPPPAAGPPREPQARAAYRQAQFDEVLRRQADGMSLHQITRAVGVSRNTVRRYVRLRTCPGHAPRPKRHSRLDPYQDYLRLRWQEGCHNGRHLFRELQARGYRGGVSIVAHLVAQWRTALPPVPPHSPVPLTPRAVRWLLVRRPDDLNDEQRAQLNHLLQLPNAGTLVLAHRLIQRFVQMVDDRCPSRLTAWLEEATRCGISELARLAAGIRRDDAAVSAARDSPWSNGPTEGHINRLKLLKRMMYGRAKFDLLQQRVLYRG